MPYSMAVNTPLSNFEANLNYKDTIDPAGINNIYPSRRIFSSSVRSYCLFSRLDYYTMDIANKSGALC
jgi:hypothetical protein